jgi:hypothetical protein
MWESGRMTTPGHPAGTWSARHAAHLSALAAVGLVGALSSVTPAVAAGHTASGVGCREAKLHLIEAVSATTSGKDIVVKAHPVTFHCGGEDDGQNIVHNTKVVHVTLTSTTKLEILKDGGGSSAEKKLAPAKLPASLSHGPGFRIFALTGPKRHLTKMIEQFHP